ISHCAVALCSSCRMICLPPRTTLFPYTTLFRSKNYKAVEYNGTTKINGEVRDTSRRVYQRLDIAYERVDPRTGKSNYQLMKSGRPPIWKDGTKIELHHLI